MTREDQLVQLGMEIGALQERLRIRQNQLDALRNGKVAPPAPAGGSAQGADRNEPSPGHTQQILAHFAQQPGKVKIQRLATILHIPNDRMKAFRSTVTRLASTGKIVRAGRGQYRGATMG